MKKKKKTVFGILVLISCLFLGCEKRKTELFTEEKQDTAEAEEQFIAEEQSVAEEQFIAEEQPSAGKADSLWEEAEQQTIFVHVCGAVRNPGVYELLKDARVYQAVEEAGGFLPEACREYINQAGVLTDGRQLYIPTEDEVRSLTESEADTRLSGLLLKPEGEKEATGAQQENGQENTGKTEGLVNINTASLNELCMLPGIGEGKAESIISYRENTGRFEKIEDIMKVDGIKEGLFGKIRDLITTG